MFTPNWQTYKVERRDRGLRRFRARSTFVEVNGHASTQHNAFTQAGAERWIENLRRVQVNGWETA